MSVSLITVLIEKILAAKGRKSLADIDRGSVDAIGSNTALLMRILSDNKNTEYGKKFGFDGITSVEDFKKKVPFSDYDTYAPYIERMVKNGEKDLITAYPVIQYAETSGSVGVQKKIPVTDRSMAIYSKYTITRVCSLADEHYRKILKRKLPFGKGLNTLETECTVMDDGTPRGSISGSAARTYKPLFPYYLTSPIPVLFPEGGMNMQYMKARFALEDRDMIFMFSVFMTNLVDIMNYMKNNWELIVDDIEHGTINEEVCEPEAAEKLKKYLKPNPERAAELRKIFSEGFDEPIIPKLWKKMSWICAIGTGGFASYTEKMRQYSGDLPIDFSIYGASEGMFAACRFMSEGKFIPLTDSCFYEFLPADAPADACETDTLTLDQLEEGKEYEIIITNQCGFYRYRIKDVIRVIGKYKTNPIITFAYRKSQVVNLAAEKTTEEHLDVSVKRLGAEAGCTFPDYCIYVDTDAEPAKYVMLVEPDRPLSAEETEGLSEKFEKILCDVNPEYAVCRYDRSIGDPDVLIQQQQTHALWRDLKMHRGSSSNQVKPVRVLDVPMKQKFFFGLLEEDKRKK